MKKINFSFLIILTIWVMFSSCGGEKSNEESNNQSDSLNTALNKVDSTISDSSSNAALNSKSDLESKIKFTITETTNQDGEPSSKIVLTLDSESKSVSTISGSASKLEKNQYKDLGIPENALDACSSFWAGLGEFFYVIPTEMGYQVYRGEKGEEQGQSEPASWKKFKEFTK